MTTTRRYDEGTSTRLLGLVTRSTGSAPATPTVAGTASRAGERSAAIDDASPAFERLFRETYPRLVVAAIRVLGDADAAQDAAQEAFLAFRRRAHPPDAPFAEAWLHAAVVHEALNQLRSERRRQRRQTAHGMALGDAPGPRDAGDPAGLVEVAESRDEVRRALRRMSPRSASVLVLRHSGLSYVEVATALGIPTNQVGTLLRRAEAALRKELDDATPR